MTFSPFCLCTFVRLFVCFVVVVFAAALFVRRLLKLTLDNLVNRGSRVWSVTIKIPAVKTGKSSSVERKRSDVRSMIVCPIRSILFQELFLI